MDFRMRETLRKSRIFLIENVVFDALCDHLIDQDIFSESMLEHIKAGNENIEKIRRMLDYLTKRPDNCFQKFLNALVNSSQEHCAAYVYEVYVRSGPTQISSPESPTDPGENDWNAKPAIHLPSIANPSIPMEFSSTDPSSEYSGFSSQVSQSSPENISDPASMEYGFPETPSGMSGSAISGSAVSTGSYPVQESSALSGFASPLSPVSYSSSASVGVGGASGGTARLENENVAAVNSAGDQHRQTVYERHRLSNQNNVYRMESNPRGLALVINNEQFKTMTPRMGSKRDMENLHHLFKNLGFDICHQMDKTAEEMKALLQSFAKYEALARVDALAIVILSHGGRDGVIYGKDGYHRDNRAQAYITDDEIRDIFSARNCPLMAMKPKLVIIQACRGRNEDVADSPEQHIPPAPSSSRRDGVQDRAMMHDGGSLPSSVSSSSSSRIANMADMCLIHSTVPGYVSYRHPTTGSPFVNVLTEVFRQKSTHEHLTDMMAEVSQRLASMQLPEDLRTIPCTTGTLTKKWFLNPLHFH